MMTFAKPLLYIALGVVTYLLILQWGEHYNAPPAPAVTNGSPAVSSASSTRPAESIEGDIPTTGLPGQTQASSGAAAPALRVQSDAAPGNIRIETPTIDATISTRGGDIIELQLPAFVRAQNDPQPFRMMLNQDGHTYAAQSGLTGPDGIDTRASGRPVYLPQQTSYKLLEGDAPREVVLTWEQGEMRVEKIYTFSADSYIIELKHRVFNRSERPIYLGTFGTLVRDAMDPIDKSSSGLGVAGYVGGAITLPDDSYHKLDFDDIEDQSFLRSDIPGGWIALLQRYFVSAWIPDQQLSFNYQSRKMPSGLYQFGFYSSESTRIDPGQGHEFATRLYVGPKIQKDLKALAPHLELTVDFGWLFFIGEPLFAVLDYIFGYVKNWGFAIVLLTLMVKTSFFWLSHIGYRSSARMRLLAPKMAELRERFPDERAKQMQETMALYRKHKVNPLGGCLPLMIPMPVFIALYWVLLESVELRHADFILWIHDLSVPDPYYILPLLMGGSMLVMQQLNPAPPNLDPMQVKMLKFMPVAFTAFFLWFPAGLVLYWLVNNLFSMLHQLTVTRRIQNQGL